MTHIKRQHMAGFGLLLLIGWLMGGATRPLQAQSESTLPASGRFVAEDCATLLPDYDVLTGDTAVSREVFCGTVTVPQRHRQPDGRELALSVVVIPYQGSDRQPDPLIFAQGGPGGSTIDLFASNILEDGNFLDLPQDLILFDQRGTLHTSPNLFCLEEEMALTDAYAEQLLGFEENLALYLEAMGQCRTRLEAEGVDLAAFNSVENAADVQAVRLALGYDEFNLYGVSYGTLLGLNLLREFPAGVRSVVLDAVVVPQEPFIAATAVTSDRAFDELFAACAADDECAQAFPNLETKFYNLVAQYNETPLRVPMTDPETGKTYLIHYDGDALMGTLFGNLYATFMLPYLPYLIEAIEQEDFGFLSADLSLRAFDRTFSTGMYYSVVCAEQGWVGGQIVLVDEIHPAVVTSNQESLTSVLAVCELWEIPVLDELTEQVVQSDVPALLLSGEFDPITPEQNALTVLEGLSQGQSFTFSNTGHGAVFDSACARNMMADFLADPTAVVNAACLSETPELDFVTPAEVLPNSFLLDLNLNLQAVDDGQMSFMQAFGWLSLMLTTSLFLFTAVLFWPILALIEQARRPSPDPLVDASYDAPHERLSGLVRAQGWLVILTALVAFLLVAGLVAIVVITYTVAPEVSIFGFVPSTWPYFLLPWLFWLLTAVLIFGLVGAWRQRAWRPVRRVYFTLLVFTAVGLSLSLWQLGLF